MGLTLITGGSGAGKTEYIYRKIIERSIKETQSQFFIIVPEQSTMQEQKKLIRMHPSHGTMNIDTVSFERLAWRVFSELSMPQPEILDDTGKIMVLRKLAGEKRDELQAFSAHLSQTGFMNEIKSMLSEFYQYGVTPELIREQMGKAEMTPLLLRKLEDMNVIYGAFREFTKERYITLEEILDVLCRVVERSRLLKNSVILLDGYTGFTPVQYRLIGLLMGLSRELYVTVTVPESVELYEEGKESDLFDMSRKMAGKLRALAKDRKIPVHEDIRLSGRPLKRFLNSPFLDHLERNMFRYPYHAFHGIPEGLSLTAAKNPAEEVELVVNQIQQLVRKNGYRYRDIAVVCGDLPGYSKELQRQFEENRIPLFLDEKKDVSGNPMVRLIKSALEILRKGFDYESMFQYFRTGLVTEELEKLDRMEVYVRSLGIRGFKGWDSVWEKEAEGAGRLNLEEMNEFKAELLAPLKIWKEKAEGRDKTVGEITEALIELLQALSVERKLEQRAEEFSARGLMKEAREYKELYGLVMELLERFYELLGTEIISKREYLDILSAGLSELKVGMIPAGADRVVAGDLKRTRLSEIKALFFVGVNEGIVPENAEKGGLLTDREREVLKKSSLELAPTAREEGFMQRFYLYLMLTKPERLLFVSWSLLSAEGKTLRPSSLIGKLKKWFPDACIMTAEEKKDVRISVQAAKRAVIEWLQNPEKIDQDPGAKELYGWLSLQEAEKKNMEELAKACSYSYKETGIGRSAARALYGNVLNGSVTRIEGYAACAYAHFLRQGLELRERREYELDFSDMGNLFHRTIDLFFEAVKMQGKDFRSIEETERKAMVKTCVEQVTLEYRNTIMNSSARNTYLAKKVERIADRTIRALIYQIKKGDFEPEAFEVDVSTRIPLKGGEMLNLRGRIDRMDVFEDEDKVYVKIMDYKSGSTSFDLALLYHGLQLQLVVYLDAALGMEKRRYPKKEVVPAGIFYYHIDDPILERKGEMTEEDIESAILKKLRMNGLVNSSMEVIHHLDRELEKESDVIPVILKDGLLQEYKSSVAGQKRFAALSGYVNRSLKTMGEEILDGRIAVDPYKEGAKTACDYCPYHSVCGFDLKTRGFGFRRFKKMKPEEIWEKLESEEDENNMEAAGESRAEGGESFG